MKILVIGAGGREHALCWKLAQSPLCEKIFCAPGNAGTALVAENVAIGIEDPEALVAFAKEQKIGLVVPGPEAAYVAGIKDACDKALIPCFGPDKAAARLESSKGFTRDLCKKYNVPGAAYRRFTDFAQARGFIETHDTPVVVKADGLAAGKGVIIANTPNEAAEAAQMMMQEYAFGAAGQEILVEEFLEGEELSFFAISDGKTVLPMTSAQDHKRIGEGDTGANTGGMGAYTPVPWADDALNARIMDEIIQPVVDGMAAEGVPFQGILFAGLMVKDGAPRLLEFNVRFGDPECQAMLMRLNGDLVKLLHAAASGNLAEAADELAWSDRAAISVVMAAEGYPEPYKKHTEIKGLDSAAALEGVEIFHAGTAIEDGRLVNTGGRVLNVTATGDTLKDAQRRAYEAVDRIDWPQGYCRRDIGWRAAG